MSLVFCPSSLGLSNNNNMGTGLFLTKSDNLTRIHSSLNLQDTNNKGVY